MAPFVVTKKVRTSHKMNTSPQWSH
uniref:Uncharacterized protein n=1 Tax=Anguilla anguilla TaxID=7936 RepID=A0A0E9WCU8_ANGAN